MKIPENLELFKGTVEELFDYSKFQGLPAGFIFFTDAVTEAEHEAKIDAHIASYGVTRSHFNKICQQTGCLLHFVWLDKEGHDLIPRMVFGITKRHRHLKFVGVTDSPELAELLGITEVLPNLQLTSGMCV